MELKSYIFLLSICLCMLMCVSYARQKKLLLFTTGFGYALTAPTAAWLIWEPLSPYLAIAIITLCIIIPAIALFLFLIDYLAACFRLELRYLVILWWLLAPLTVPLNIIGTVINLLLQ